MNMVAVWWATQNVSRPRAVCRYFCVEVKSGTSGERKIICFFHNMGEWNIHDGRNYANKYNIYIYVNTFCMLCSVDDGNWIPLTIFFTWMVKYENCFARHSILRTKLLMIISLDSSLTDQLLIRSYALVIYWTRNRR